MVSYMYCVMVAIFAIISSLVVIHENGIENLKEKNSKGFIVLATWLTLFYIQDFFWGVVACAPRINSVSLLYFLTILFHMATVVTALFWVQYVLEYLSISEKKQKLVNILLWILIVFQALLLIVNNFTMSVFYIDSELVYHTGKYRFLAFFNQYLSYVVVAVMAFFNFKKVDIDKKRLNAVFMFTLAPVIAGIFQYFFPLAPFHSIGYFMGSTIIYLYIVSDERDEMIKLEHTAEELEHRLRITEEIMNSHTDELTGLWNRRSYEEEIDNIEQYSDKVNFVYFSIDVNGLKKVNDTIGHAAGDELICGAADVIKKCFGEYGNMYRIGGDEFVAMIYADEMQLQKLVITVENEASRWKGKLCGELSLSLGYAAQSEHGDISVVELGKIADKNMYLAKEKYYSAKGVDRRGQQKAFEIMRDTYEKVLKINLTTDSFTIIQMHDAEKLAEKGYSESISMWLVNFATSGQVFHQDVNKYLELTDLEYMKHYFYFEKKPLHIFYRRKIDDTFRQAMMEIVPAEDYDDANQALYLFVKNIER